MISTLTSPTNGVPTRGPFVCCVLCVCVLEGNILPNDNFNIKHSATRLLFGISPNNPQAPGPSSGWKGGGTALPFFGGEQRNRLCSVSGAETGQNTPAQTFVFHSTYLESLANSAPQQVSCHRFAAEMVHTLSGRLRSSLGRRAPNAKTAAI